MKPFLIALVFQVQLTILSTPSLIWIFFIDPITFYCTYLSQVYLCSETDPCGDKDSFIGLLCISSNVRGTWFISVLKQS